MGSGLVKGWSKSKRSFWVSSKVQMASGLFLDSIEAAKLVFGVEIYGIEGMGAMIQRLPNAALSKVFCPILTGPVVQWI